MSLLNQVGVEKYMKNEKWQEFLQTLGLQQSQDSESYIESLS